METLIVVIVTAIVGILVGVGISFLYAYAHYRGGRHNGNG